MTGLLVLAGTPIGRPDDASPRLRAELRRRPTSSPPRTPAGCAGCAADLGVDDRPAGSSPTSRATRRRGRPSCVERAASAAPRVLLVTDAGMPSVSDPGYRLVAAAVEAGRPRHRACPGPSRGAHRARGLRAAGRPVLLRGLPAAQGGRAGRAGSRRWRAEPRTMVFFESPHRAAATLRAMAEAFGADRAGRGLPRADQDLRGGPARRRSAELAAWAEPRASRARSPSSCRGRPRGAPAAASAPTPSWPRWSRGARGGGHAAQGGDRRGRRPRPGATAARSTTPSSPPSASARNRRGPPE